MLPTILLKPLYHRGKENIAVYFNYSNDLSAIIKKIKDVRWSRTHSCWYLPLTKGHYLALKAAVQEVATINAKALKQYLEQRKALVPVATATGNPPIATIRKATARRLLEFPLSTANLEAFTTFQEQLQLKGYSPSTLKTYSNEFYQLLKLLGNVAVRDLTVEQIRKYILYCIQKEGLHEFTIHSRINAIKLQKA